MKFKQRLLTSVLIVAVLAIAFVARLWTLYIFDLLMLSLSVMAAVEIARALERQGKYTNFMAVATMPVALYVLITIVLVANLQWQYLLIMLLAAILFYFVLVMLITLFAKKTTEKEMIKYGIEDVKPLSYAVDKAIYSISVLIYPVLLFMALILLNHFYELNFIVSLGQNFKVFTWFMLLSVFVVTMMTDTMAYLVGSTFKGPKLCPLISPNKTISGALGGLFGGVGGGMALYGLFTINSTFKLEMSVVGCNWWILLSIFLLGSIVTQIGDILASAIKRKSRVKDYGTIFPGHGGVMDRMDGNIFNSILTLVSFMLIFLV